MKSNLPVFFCYCFALDFLGIYRQAWRHTLVPPCKSFIDLVLEYSSLTQHEKLELMVLGVLGAADTIYFWVLSHVPFPCVLRAALLSWFLGGLEVNVDIGKWMSSLAVVFSQYHLTLWILLQFHMNLKKQLDTCYKEASSGSDSYCIKAVGLLENSAILTISSLLLHGSGNAFCLFWSSLIPAAMI